MYMPSSPPSRVPDCAYLISSISRQKNGSDIPRVFMRAYAHENQIPAGTQGINVGRARGNRADERAISH